MDIEFLRCTGDDIDWIKGRVFVAPNEVGKEDALFLLFIDTIDYEEAATLEFVVIVCRGSTSVH